MIVMQPVSIKGVVFGLVWFSCYCLASHLLMSYRTLLAYLPQLVQHYPYSTEKSFEP